MPVTPGATGANFDILLAFSLDAEANRRVQAGVSSLEQELKRIQDEAKGVGGEYKKSGDEVKKTSKEIVAELRAQARVMRSEAAAITDDLKQAQIGYLRELSGAIGNISTKALVAGGAIVGGIFAEVNAYVSKAPEATKETRAWAAAMADLGKSRERVDQELLKTALPLLRQAADVARQAAGFVEKHPEITSMALKAGAILVGVGVIGTAVSRGIKLVADIQYLTTIPIQLSAAKLQDIAADKQLAAAQVRLKELGVTPSTTAAGGGALATAGRVIGTATLAVTAAYISFKSVDFVLEKLGLPNTGDMFKAQKDFLLGIPKALKEGVKLNDLAAQVLNVSYSAAKARKETEGLTQASNEAAQALGRVSGSMNEAAIVEAFSSWKEDDARLVREAVENRKRILADAEKEIAQITRSYAIERRNISRQFNEQRSNIVRQFEQESKQAEEDYLRSRGDIIREGHERLQELEQDHRERLRQIQEDSDSRLAELAADRDALGIDLEKERRAKEEEEENRSYQLERSRTKKEIEQRIADLDRQYATERERRQAQYEQDLRDNAAQRAEALARAAEAHREELRQARESTAQKLRELQEGLNEERKRRREVFLEQIRDLDDSLLGERALRQRHYQDMLNDAEAFFEQYRAAMPSGSSFSSVTGSTGKVPTKDSGGYAGRGLHWLAMNGIPEFILSGSTTRAAERAIGSSLTDESLGRLFSRVGDARTAVYNDYRRLDAPLSKDARKVYEKSAEDAILRALGVS